MIVFLIIHYNILNIWHILFAPNWKKNIYNLQS